ncbi:hypothetical protein ACS8YF_02980 [Salinisphaera sp. SWV1]|uniref:hypothetical protein n=1 Tax=Salinisphaera sp. SWV1 TaxID=3454139 RepID=UPI003F85ABDF
MARTPFYPTGTYVPGATRVKLFISIFCIMEFIFQICLDCAPLLFLFRSIAMHDRQTQTMSEERRRRIWLGFDPSDYAAG